jgi:hypothetical protein
MVKSQSANLTFTGMELAISRINKRINELEIFDVGQLLTGFDSSRIALEHKLDELLKDIFGYDTVEYRAYGPRGRKLRPGATLS